MGITQMVLSENWNVAIHVSSIVWGFYHTQHISHITMSISLICSIWAFRIGIGCIF